MPIRRLPDALINRIAAGEVVERPAAVVKELVENAIDAGAGRITISTAGGGRDFIRIEDDGGGMSREDLVLAVERHATSKLADDGLDDIRTLGFRGEALASIGAVSTMTIASRQQHSDTGFSITVRCGRADEPLPEAMNRGTIVTVRDLFAQTPARLKFLRSDRAEAAAVTDVVRRLALANPAIHFVLDGADRSVPLNWPGTVGEGALEARAAQVIGDEFIGNAVALGHVRHGVVVTGLAGLPTFSRANSLSQYYFVNGRAVRDKVLLGAVRAAFADFTFRDRFPVLALYLSVDPAAVDVNVHPAKTELRFRDPGGVRSAVINAIGAGLDAAGFRASSTVADDVINAFRTPEMAGAEFGAATSTAFGSSPPPLHSGGSPIATLNGFEEPSARFESAAVAEDEPRYPLGTARAQMFDNFIVAQSGDSLLLVDQHAAHERLVYERFKAALREGGVSSQTHLIPAVIELDPEDCERLEDAAPELQRLGLAIERFGPRAIAVRATPALLGHGDIEGLIHDIADELAEWESATALPERLEAIIGRMACHGSVRSGRRLKVEEMNALLREMEVTPHSGQCIHGRPTYVELSKRDIERLFGRTR